MGKLWWQTINWFYTHTHTHTPHTYTHIHAWLEGQQLDSEMSFYQAILCQKVKHNENFSVTQQWSQDYALIYKLGSPRRYVYCSFNFLQFLLLDRNFLGYPGGGSGPLSDSSSPIFPLWFDYLHIGVLLKEWAYI